MQVQHSGHADKDVWQRGLEDPAKQHARQMIQQGKQHVQASELTFVEVHIVSPKFVCFHNSAAD
jgi:hypothetical protein